MSFARNSETHAYYERRAAEYDEWYEGTGIFARRSRPGWREELEQVTAVLAGLPPGRTLDVACGTGFLTRHLRGFVVGLDYSPSMVARAQKRLPDGLAVVGDALALPFAARSFRRVVAGHFYGHLVEAERERLLAEASRVADEIVVADSARHGGTPAAEWQDRVLNDGSRHRVYKRYLDPSQLVDELGAEILHAGRWFVVGRATLPRRVSRSLSAPPSSDVSL